MAILLFLGLYGEPRRRWWRGFEPHGRWWWRVLLFLGSTENPGGGGGLFSSGGSSTSPQNFWFVGSCSVTSSDNSPSPSLYLVLRALKASFWQLHGLWFANLEIDSTSLEFWKPGRRGGGGNLRRRGGFPPWRRRQVDRIISFSASSSGESESSTMK